VIHAKVIWPPYPYKAGFCVADDPDAATFEQTKAVCDFLMSRSFVITKAVWPFRPTEKCGIPPTPSSTLRGITLEDSAYLSYCKELHSQGFELCLHGASAGNNVRERTRDAFDFLTNHIAPSETFICHSKNADNIYWEDKTTSLFPFRTLLRWYSKHSCSGEDRASPYFWGDICASRINQIRLYKTRCLNTLKRNPSMPYHDPLKPLVNAWFSATKRSLSDCATTAALDRLKRENGLTVLYQYLYRYADPQTVKLNKKFVQSVDRISSDPEILVRTVSSMMERLRGIQGVFVAFQERSFWLVNVSDVDIDNLQIVSSHPLTVETKEDSIVALGCTLLMKTLPKKSIKFVRASDRIIFSHRNAFRLGNDKHVTFTLPFGELMINLSETDWQAGDRGVLPPGSFLLQTVRSGTGIPLLSALSRGEELRLVSDQISVIAREVILKGRSLNTEKYLDGSRDIPLENHDHW
jgi:hypothetical protein